MSVPASNSLSDFFSKKSLEQLIPTSLKVGSVYRVDLGELDGLTPDLGYTTNNKIVIVVGFDPAGNAIGVVLINSRFHSRDDIMLKGDQYSDKVISKNSYVDPNEIFLIPDINFDYGNAKFCGDINTGDLIFILDAILKSKDIPKAEKKRYRIYNELQKIKDDSQDV